MYLELKGQTRITLWKQLQDAYESTAYVLISCRTTIGLVKVPFRGKQAEQACRNLWVEHSGLANASCDRPLLFVDIRRTRWTETKNWTSNGSQEEIRLTMLSVCLLLFGDCITEAAAVGRTVATEEQWPQKTSGKWRISANSIINELILTWHSRKLFVVLPSEHNWFYNIWTDGPAIL